MYMESRARLIQLLEHNRSALLSLGRRHVGKFLQLLCPHLAEVSEQKDERELNALLRHHEEALHKQTFHDLRTNALEKACKTFVLDNVLHHLDEALERLAVPYWRWFGLQADLGDNEWLCSNGSECLGHGAEGCRNGKW